MGIGAGQATRAVLGTAVLAAALIVPGGGRALACSCDDAPLSEYADSIVAAFVGRQTDRRVDDEIAVDGAELTFSVREVYHGEVTDPFTVRTAAEGSACGLDLAERTEIAIAAFTRQGRPLVGLCGSVVTTAELLAEFGEPRAPAPSPAVADHGGGDDWAARLALGALLLVVVGAAGAWFVHRRDVD